jgi:hypothetical protein
MISVQPNRHARKKAARLAKKATAKPWVKKALATLRNMQSLHESAHGVIAMALGFGCSRITMTPPMATITMDLARPFECLIVSYAGSAGTRILTGQACDGGGTGNQAAGTHGDDKALAERCIAEMKEQGLDTAGAHGRAKAEVERLVRQYEPVIRKFAAALESKLVLTGRDMVTLLQGEGGRACLGA